MEPRCQVGREGGVDVMEAVCGDHDVEQWAAIEDIKGVD